MTWHHGARGEKTMSDFVAEIPHRVQMEANSGCWLWEGQNCRGGYGSAKIDGRKTPAHRLSYIAHNGPLRDDEHVLHSCDTPACINPDHLRPGSRDENQKEARERGRFSGEVRPYRRLSKAENEAIVAFAKTVSVRAAAREFGIDPATVRRKIKDAK